MAFCPITLQLCEDPVNAPDGHTYDRKAIEGWLDIKNSSPMTRQPMDKSSLVPSQLGRELLQKSKEQKKAESQLPADHNYELPWPENFNVGMEWELLLTVLGNMLATNAIFATPRVAKVIADMVTAVYHMLMFHGYATEHVKMRCETFISRELHFHYACLPMPDTAPFDIEVSARLFYTAIQECEYLLRAVFGFVTRLLLCNPFKHIDMMEIYIAEPSSIEDIRRLVAKLSDFERQPKVVCNGLKRMLDAKLLGVDDLSALEDKQLKELMLSIGREHITSYVFKMANLPDGSRLPANVRDFTKKIKNL